MQTRAGQIFCVNLSISAPQSSPLPGWPAAPHVPRQSCTPARGVGVPCVCDWRALHTACQARAGRRSLWRSQELRYRVKQLCCNSLTGTCEPQAVCLSLKWAHRYIQTFEECSAGSGLGTVTAGVMLVVSSNSGQLTCYLYRSSHRSQAGWFQTTFSCK